MSDSTKVRTGRHVVHTMHAHLVFVIKYRRRVLNKSMLNLLEKLFSSVCDGFAAELIEFEGEKDYVHLLVKYPPKLSISTLVNNLKGISSRILRKDFSKQLASAL